MKDCFSLLLEIALITTSLFHANINLFLLDISDPSQWAIFSVQRVFQRMGASQSCLSAGLFCVGFCVCVHLGCGFYLCVAGGLDAYVAQQLAHSHCVLR